MLIPRRLLFGNPVRTSPRISPDGRLLSYLAPDDNDVLQVWVRSIGGDDDRAVTADRKRGIRGHAWTFLPDVLLYFQDSDGDENWHVYSVDLANGVVRDLTPFEGVQAQFLAMSHRVPDEVFVAMNLLDRQKHDVYRVNLRNGAVELDTENPGNFVGWCSDEDLKIRAAVAMDASGSQSLEVRTTVDEPWRTAVRFTADEEGAPLSFSADGSSLYYLSNRDAPAERLLALDLASGAESVIADDPQYDVTEVFIHPTRFHVQAAGFVRERLTWQVLDPEIAGDFETLTAGRDGDVQVLGRDLADRKWVVAYFVDDGPVYFYVYDRKAGTLELLFSNQPELEDLPLAKMKPFSYQARDGLTIHGYLTLPPGASEGQRLPAVLLVHGGPWARDTWGFDAEAQWLANRGYAVLQPNFRGSTGYGREFLNAGNKEWAAGMHDDLIDGVNWLVEQGIADPRRIAIMGGSYGGYATLVGLAFTPEVFAAGVDIVGPSNLLTLIESIPPYWAPLLGLFKHRVGDPDGDRQFLESRSPLFFAERIRSPLLIAQGANDPRVKQAESEQIVAAMRRLELPVEYVVYEDEGHGFARPENRLHFFAVAEAFLAGHLGGEFEPMEEIEGHSAVRK